MNEFKNSYLFSKTEWETCLRVLELLKNDPLENPDNQRFGGLISKIHKNAKKQLKRDISNQKKIDDIELLKKTTIAKNALNNTTSFDTNYNNTPTFSKLNSLRRCYSCNKAYDLAHSFYHRLCPTCAELNYTNRFLNLDLTNRNVILTGGRVKIGYATAIKLLKSNANVTITTRFPALALEQFKKEKDYNTWEARLDIYGLDLRNLKEVQNFIQHYISKNKSLDILINNAAQTIKYTDEYYAPLIQKEENLLLDFSKQNNLIANKTPISNNANLLQIPFEHGDIPLNRFGQPVDFRAKNSWNSTLEEISVYELLEVNLINHISPYILIKELTPLFQQSSFSEKFIINVTSSEGQFSYENKNEFHPHTNMTKAALNMITRTSATEFAKKGIYMSSVDVGWVSTGAFEEKRKNQFENGMIPPLDPVDGAARIFHPIFEAIENKVIFTGSLLKNYQVVNW